MLPRPSSAYPPHTPPGSSVAGLASLRGVGPSGPEATPLSTASSRPRRKTRAHPHFSPGLYAPSPSAFARGTKPLRRSPLARRRLHRRIRPPDGQARNPILLCEVARLLSGLRSRRLLWRSRPLRSTRARNPMLLCEVAMPRRYEAREQIRSTKTPNPKRTILRWPRDKPRPPEAYPGRGVYAERSRSIEEGD